MIMTQKTSERPVSEPMMTAEAFERWFKQSGMTRREAGNLFGRRPRTLDSWRKGRVPVPPYAVIIIEQRGV